MNINPHSSSSSTMTTTNDVVNIPLPIGDPPAHSEPQSSTLPMFSVSNSVSFEELAKRADNVMTNVLQEYGPAITMSNPMHQRNAPIHTQAPSLSFTQRPPMSMPLVHHQMPVYPISINQPSTYGTTSTSTSFLPTSQPQTTMPFRPQQATMRLSNSSNNLTNSINSYNIYATASSSISTNPNPFNAGSSTQTISGRPSALEPPNSPPLDALNQNNATVQSRVTGDNNTTVGVSETIDNDRLKASGVDRLGDCRNRIKNMSQNELIQEYLLYERDLAESQRKRSTYEKDVNDLTRKAHGQNLELNPEFIRKKRLYLKELDICEQYNECLNIISDLCEKKFANKLTKSTTQGQPLQKRNQRPRMSTAAPSMPRVELDRSQDKNIIFEFRDHPMWCKDCDQHLDSVKQYCEHLHERIHQQMARKLVQPPWTSSFNVLPRSKVYNHYISMCAKLSNKLRSPFTVSDLDQALNPTITNELMLKDMNLKRQRGTFSDDDLLYTMKGYDQLIPIKGYYCKLCDKSMNDSQEAEQHLKSFQHCNEHVKFVALKPSDERNFRKNLEKSLKEHSGSHQRSSSSTSSHHQSSKHQRDPHQQRSSSTSRDDRFMPSTSRSSSSTRDASVSQFSARLPYKKPTSHIVDDHDVVANKFDKRDKPGQQQASNKPTSDASVETTTTKTNTGTKESSDQPPAKKKDSPKKSRRHEIPEIVPVNKNKPAGALKRLRRTESPQALFNVDHLFNQPNSSGESDTDVEEVRPKKRVSSSGRARRIIEDDDEEDDDRNKNDLDYDDDDDDVQIIDEIRLPRGDPDSPFPDLELVVTGNYHVDIIKDKRLAMPTTIRLERLDMEKFKDMIYNKDIDALYSRCNKTMLKKEPGEYDKDLAAVTSTARTYLDPNNGDLIPVNPDESSEDEAANSHEVTMKSLENWFCDD